MPGLRGQRDVQRDDVGLGRGARRDRRRVRRARPRRRMPRRAAPSPGRSARCPTISTVLPSSRSPEHELERELPRLPAPDEPVALGHPAQQRQHQRQRDLGGGAGQHVRRVRDDHAPTPGRVEVDVVDARPRSWRRSAAAVLPPRGRRRRPSTVSIVTIPSRLSGRSDELEISRAAPVRPRLGRWSETWTRGVTECIISE